MQNNSGDVLLLSVNSNLTSNNTDLLNKKRDTLVSMIIHDLKNPLQAQISGLELLSKGTFGVLNHSQQEIVKLTIESAKYMFSLISDILIAHKSECGKLEPVKENFPIATVINDVINENSSCLIEKGIKINFISKLPKNNNEINADRRLIKRVIENLVINAINYSEKNSEIKIEISKKSSLFEFNIGNSGKEIPSEIAQNVFDKYIGTNLCEKIGTGLGLYFCKLAIETHNGVISLKTSKNYNVFSFKIPFGK